MAKNKRIIKQKNTVKIGKPPGSLIYTGNEKDVNISIDLLQFNEIHFLERNQIKKINEIDILNDSYVSWLDIKGLHNEEIISELGELTNIHSLTLEDLLNVNQRPKIDFYFTYIYIVIQALKFDANTQNIESEQLSIILGENYVMTFWEKPNNSLDFIKNRIKTKLGKIVSLGSDYLAYAILDAIIDDYYDVIENLGDQIEDLEEKLMLEPHKIQIQDIYIFKRKLLEIRKAVWPIREVVTKLQKSETDFIKEKTSLYLRDLYDHSIQLIETIDIYRDIISGLADMYLSTTSNRLNEIMKVLTILSSVFIPITFIAGVYGMNFKNMPELEWQYGYLYSIGLMFLIAIIMLFYFRKKKWM